MKSFHGSNNSKCTPQLLKLTGSKVLVLMLLTAGPVSGQGSLQSPLEVIQRFKTLLDNGNVLALCRMIAEPDGSGPLRPANLEQTQNSITELVKIWQGKTAIYERVISPLGKDPSKAQVIISFVGLRQEARFTLLRYQETWLILDIEVFFR